MLAASLLFASQQLDRHRIDQEEVVEHFQELHPHGLLTASLAAIHRHIGMPPSVACGIAQDVIYNGFEVLNSRLLLPEDLSLGGHLLEIEVHELQFKLQMS